MQFQENNYQNKENQVTVNSTVKYNQQNNNNVNNTPNFKKEITETIIVAGKEPNEELIITQRRIGNDNITQINSKEDPHIKKLKTINNIKLLNINFSEREKTEYNENGNKNNCIRKKSLFNENNRNKRIQLTNENAYIRNEYTNSIVIKSPIDKQPEPIKLNLSAIDRVKNPNLLDNKDNIKENDTNNNDLFDDQTQRKINENNFENNINL